MICAASPIWKPGQANFWWMFERSFACAEHQCCCIPHPKPSVTCPLNRQHVTNPLPRSFTASEGGNVWRDCCENRSLLPTPCNAVCKSIWHAHIRGFLRGYTDYKGHKGFGPFGPSLDQERKIPSVRQRNQ